MVKIGSKYELLNGPAPPPAPVYPKDQQDSYADNVCACLGVPRSYVISNQSAVQTTEEQSDRDAKLNAHFKAVSQGLEKVLSFAESLKDDSEGSDESSSESDSPQDDPNSEKTESKEEEEGEPSKQKKTKLSSEEKGQILDKASTKSGLLVQVKITLALSIERVTALIQSGLLKRDTGLKMMADMLNLQLSDFVTEKDLLKAQALELAASTDKPKPQVPKPAASTDKSKPLALSSSKAKRKADK